MEMSSTPDVARLYLSTILRQAFPTTKLHGSRFNGCRLQFPGTRSSSSMSSWNPEGSIGEDRNMGQRWCGRYEHSLASRSCRCRKSAIAQTVAETCAGRNQLAATFFFARTVARRNAEIPLSDHCYSDRPVSPEKRQSSTVFSRMTHTSLSVPWAPST
jgi:hypothetical protein